MTYVLFSKLMSHSYNVSDTSGFRRHRINYNKKFANQQNYINSIENFWNQAKWGLRKYNGIDRESFYLFLKNVSFVLTLAYRSSS